MLFAATQSWPACWRQFGTCTHRPPPADAVPTVPVDAAGDASSTATATGPCVWSTLCSLDDRFSFRRPDPDLSVEGLSLLFLPFSVERSNFGFTRSTGRYPLRMVRCPPLRAYATPSETSPCSSAQYLACGKAWTPVVPPVLELYTKPPPKYSAAEPTKTVKNGIPQSLSVRMTAL